MGTLATGATTTSLASPTAIGGGGTAPMTNRQTTPTGTGTASPIGGAGSPSLNSLYPTAPPVSTFDSTAGTAATTGAAPVADAQYAKPLAGINGGMINPNDSTNAASQLNAITASGSPYMEQARQQGMLSAASRGLQNSSLGAGAAEASAVQAAAPLAEQNAQSATAGELQNSQLGTQANEFNAGQANQNQQLNAQLQTQTSQFNASQKQAADATNAAMINQVNSQITGIIGQMNTQYLSGSQAQVLAQIQGTISEHIATTQSTAALIQSTLSGVSAIMTNNNLDANRTSTAVTAELNTLNSAMKALDVVLGGSGSVPQVSNAPPPGAPAPAPVRPKL